MAHWAERYVGSPYLPREFDCADLVVKVQRELFGREILLPTDHAATPIGRARQILECRNEFAEPTAAPIEGDAVLMLTRGRAQHVGVLCIIGGHRWVLHNAQTSVEDRPGFRGGVCLHRVDLLPAYGYKIEGYYRWT